MFFFFSNWSIILDKHHSWHKVCICIIFFLFSVPKMPKRKLDNDEKIHKLARNTELSLIELIPIMTRVHLFNMHDCIRLAQTSRKVRAVANSKSLWKGSFSRTPSLEPYFASEITTLPCEFLTLVNRITMYTAQESREPLVKAVTRTQSLLLFPRTKMQRKFDKSERSHLLNYHISEENINFDQLTVREECRQVPTNAGISLEDAGSHIRRMLLRVIANHPEYYRIWCMSSLLIDVIPLGNIFDQNGRMICAYYDTRIRNWCSKCNVALTKAIVTEFGHLRPFNKSYYCDATCLIRHIFE